MPLVAAAICPHPPLLVPDIAAGAAAETDDLRAACDAAVGALARSGARSVVVVGSGDCTKEYSPPFHGSLAPWGAPVDVTFGDLPGEGVAERLPLSLLIGGWLLRRTGDRADDRSGDRADDRSGDRPRGWPANLPDGLRMVMVDSTTTAAECRELGGRLGTTEPWAMLVTGDGSACRGLKSPGYDDPRAQPYDEEVARALADADPEALLRLDPILSAELKAVGRAPWQVLAGAAVAEGPGWRGDLTYQAAPYGVAYFVATWTRR